MESKRLRSAAPWPRYRVGQQFARTRRSVVFIVVTVLLGLSAPLFSAAPADAAGLTSIAWEASSATTSATGVTYSYGFTAPTAGNVSSVTMTVPSGTLGTPTVVAGSAQAAYSITLASQSVTRSGTTLTFSFTSVYIQADTVLSLQIGGLTNTSTAGSYTSTITTKNGATSVDSGPAGAFTFTATPLTGLFWTASSTKTGAGSVSYSYGFKTGTAATLSKVTISVPPGTGGTPTVVAVTPSAISGGSVSLSGTTLTYTFTATSVAVGVAVTVQIGGLTNTTSRGSYAKQIVTIDGTSSIDAGVTSALAFTANLLTGLSWSASDTAVGGTGAAYTFGFTTTTAKQLTSVTMSVPPGTSGTPAVGAVSANPGYSFTLASPTVTRSGTTITFSFTPMYVPASTVVSIEITGLANTSTAGSYASTIVTITDQSPVGPVDSGTAPAVNFTSTTLTALSWSAASTSTGATGVSYGYSFGLSATSTISKVTMSVPPGTGGTPAVGTVSPSSISGGTVALSGQTLTYTFPAPVSISDTQTLTIGITGITNTSTSSIYAASLVAHNGTTVAASATTPSVTFTSAVLTSLSWTASSTTTGAIGVTYAYGFTTPAATLTSVTMTVPSGTGGTPGIGTVSIYDPTQGAVITPTSQAMSRSGTTITFSFASTYFGNNTTFQIGVTGITTTSAAGTYTSAITTKQNTTALASGTTPSLSFSSTSLGTPIWTVTSTATGATAMSYGYEFVISNGSSLSAVTMSLPAGTGGTPTVGAVSPSAISGGTVSLTNNTLTYSFSSATVPVGTSVSITIDGLTNTSTSGTYASTITVVDSGSAVLASGVTTSVNFTSTVLTNLSWTPSSLKTSTTGVTYTYGFTTGSAHTLTDITMTVPSGTGGTPVLGTVSAVQPSSGSVALANPTVSQLGTTLIFHFNSVWVPSGTVFSVQVTGMTNTSSPGKYLSAHATKNAGATVDSGATSTRTFVGGPLAAPTWSSDKTTAGADNTTHTYAFTTASSSQLSSITMSVPAGTGGTPTIGTVTPSAVATGGSVALSGNTLTYSFTPSTIAAGTAISLQISGLTTTMSPGKYTSTITTKNGASAIDSGTTPSVTIAAQSLTFTNACAAPPVSCTADANGSTQITLLVIPGWATASTASVELSVQTNATNGYRVQARMSPLTRVGGLSVLAQAATLGSASKPLDQFYASATLSSSGTSAAALCTPYGSATPYVGYPTSFSRSIWIASASTGNGTDHVIVKNAFQQASTQTAGRYTGTITYTVEPLYAGVQTC